MCLLLHVTACVKALNIFEKEHPKKNTFQEEEEEEEDEDEDEEEKAAGTAAAALNRLNKWAGTPLTQTSGLRC